MRCVVDDGYASAPHTLSLLHATLHPTPLPPQHQKTHFQNPASSTISQPPEPCETDTSRHNTNSSNTNTNTNTNTRTSLLTRPEKSALEPFNSKAGWRAYEYVTEVVLSEAPSEASPENEKRQVPKVCVEYMSRKRSESREKGEQKKRKERGRGEKNETTKRNRPGKKKIKTAKQKPVESCACD